MSPGAPFEVVNAEVMGRNIRIYRHAPENLSVILDRARANDDAEFIVSGSRRLTYAGFYERADAVSAALQARNDFKSGASIGIAMKNCPEWMITFVGIINAGGVAVLVNSRGTGENMLCALTDTDCALVFADARRAEKLEDAGFEGATLGANDIARFASADNPITHTRTSDETAAMFFTSGTTGVAKAAAISHRALITGVMNVQLAMAAIFQKMAQDYKVDMETLRSQLPQSCSLLVFPLFHTSGCSAVFLTALANGGKLVLMDRWDADAALELMETERITTFGGVPTMHWDVLRAKTFAERDLSSVMSISCGGQALPLNLLAEIREKFPRSFIGAGYGMTETSGAISQANGEAFVANPQASGFVLPMMDVQITGEDGRALPVGEVGEIWTKGATLMQGYYGRPEATASAMSGDWFKTGDIGRLDADGYIYIVDRKTDMIISGGENIYCAEVEQALGRHPDVLQVTTFGVPDDRLGERLVAGIVPKHEGLTSGSVIDFVKGHLADYKVPTEVFIATDPFSLNAMGKVEKHKVREAFLAGKAA